MRATSPFPRPDSRQGSARWPRRCPTCDSRCPSGARAQSCVASSFRSTRVTRSRTCSCRGRRARSRDEAGSALCVYASRGHQRHTRRREGARDDGESICRALRKEAALVADSVQCHRRASTLFSAPTMHDTRASGRCSSRTAWCRRAGIQAVPMSTQRADSLRRRVRPPRRAASRRSVRHPTPCRDCPYPGFHRCRRASRRHLVPPSPVPPSSSDVSQASH